MIRSGEAMEQAVRACCKGIKIGKILVQRVACDRDDEEKPPMVYEKLPEVRWMRRMHPTLTLTLTLTLDRTDVD